MLSLALPLECAITRVVHEVVLCEGGAVVTATKIAKKADPFVKVLQRIRQWKAMHQYRHR